MIVVFTDGGITKGTSCGGASLIEIKNNNEYSVIKSSIKICEESTNNEAELFGIYKAIELLEPNNSEPYIIFSDSEYAVKSLTIWILDWFKTYSYKKENSICVPSMLTKGKSPVKNAKLLCMIINLIVDKNLKIRFKNVRGHKSPNKDQDIMSQALYFRESNNLSKMISKDFAKFICTYNEYIDKLVGDCIWKFKEGDIEKLEVNNVEVDIRYGKMFDDEKYKHLYILNKAIMNKYKELLGINP
jgi:ribonuclease HI